MQRPINSCNISPGCTKCFVWILPKKSKNSCFLRILPTKKQRIQHSFDFETQLLYGLPTNFLNLPVFCRPQLAIDPFDPWSAHGSSPRTQKKIVLENPSVDFFGTKMDQFSRGFFGGLLSLLFDTYLTHNLLNMCFWLFSKKEAVANWVWSHLYALDSHKIKNYTNHLKARHTLEILQSSVFSIWFSANTAYWPKGTLKGNQNHRPKSRRSPNKIKSPTVAVNS